MFSPSHSQFQLVTGRLMLSLFLAWPSLCAFPSQTKNESIPRGSKSVQFKDVETIFQQSCAKCHSENMAGGQLRLDSEASILRGGVSGAAIVPGRSDASLLVKRILGLTDAPRMPLNG